MQYSRTYSAFYRQNSRSVVFISRLVRYGTRTLSSAVIAIQNQITLEDVWKSYR